MLFFKVKAFENMTKYAKLFDYERRFYTYII